jgi:PIN domain nuclease of toxin-antitoxin system
MGCFGTMILLDTHIWLWWLHTPEQLSERGRALLTIGENQNTLIVSAISVWEIAVKHSNGKLPLPLSVNEWFALAKTRPGITIEPLDPLDAIDAIASTKLPGDFHKDPADRIIVAIAYRRNIELMTCDQKILNYPHVKTLW